jgi:LuxR family maltose regulon positive regulatory protein
VALFAECISVGERAGNWDTVFFAETELGIRAMDQGRWSEAGERLERALGLVAAHRMSDYATGVLVFAAATRLALHRGDMAGARRHLAQATRARPACTFVFPFLAVRARVQLIRACSALGDRPSARHLLREVDDILMRRPDLGTLCAEVEAVRLMLDEEQQVAVVTGSSPLTPAELRLLPYLQTHLTIREIGERLFISRNTASTEIGSIYRKLGVSSRGDAVRRSVALGLLGE